MTHRVYSETLPFAELVRPRTLDLLARYRLELVLAVRPWDEPALPDVARALRDVGVPLSIWPMLSDEQGRWASVHNAAAFGAFVLSACDALEASSARPRDVLFDLEPPFGQTRTLTNIAGGASGRAEGIGRFASGLARPSASRFDLGSESLARAVSEIHARGIATSMAVWPLVALDPPGDDAWQVLLGTPVDALRTGHVSVMMYTSILEGWSRGTLQRKHTTALLAGATARAVRRWGPLAGISLGCVGTGAFEDEPTYREPSELAEDAAIARASGCEKLTLFDLGGVLARAPAERWLEAFVHPTDERLEVPATKRVEAARRLARAATWALGRPRSVWR
jgi:hypothetical protein